MRVSRQEAAANRARIVEAASRLFRERGFGVGVDEVCREAGLTHGGLYSRFGSKDALQAEAIRHTLAESVTNWERAVARAQEEGRDPFVVLVDRYLTPHHRDTPGAGCLVATLAHEACRAVPAVQEALAEGTEALVATLARHAPGATPEARRAAAEAAFATMLGGLILARAVPAERSDATLAAARLAAHAPSVTR